MQVPGTRSLLLPCPGLHYWPPSIIMHGACLGAEEAAHRCAHFRRCSACGEAARACLQLDSRSRSRRFDEGLPAPSPASAGGRVLVVRKEQLCIMRSV